MGFPSIDGASNLPGSGEYAAQAFDVVFSAPPSELLICQTCGMRIPRIARICPNDGTDLLIRQGSVFAEKYELLDYVGSGAMGIIYRARHLILDKIVAIKVLHNSTIDSNLLVRFQREAKAASSLSHVNVITVYDFGVHAGMAPYMVMDYLNGKTLAQHLEERGTIPLREALEIVEQILSALTHAQKKGVLHRDLKPGNIILLEEEDELPIVKILDFGLAKLLDKDEHVLSAVGTALGSPAYMSPEQAAGLKVDARSDLYSLGCLLYELLSGSPPLLGDSPMETLMNRLNRKVPAVRDVIAEQSKRSRDYNPQREIPTIVELFLAKLLERDQRDRFQSAQDARDYLSTIWEYVDVPETISERAQFQRSRNPRDSVKDIPAVELPSSQLSSEEIQTSKRDGSLSGNHPRIRHKSSSPALQSTTGEFKNHRRSHNGLRKLVVEQQQVAVPVAQLPGAQIHRFDPHDLVIEVEKFANMILDLSRQLRRSAPSLFWLSFAIAVVALVVIGNILR